MNTDQNHLPVNHPDQNLLLTGKSKTGTLKKALSIAIPLAAVFIISFTNKKENGLSIGSLMPLSETKIADISGKLVSLKDIKKENGLLVIFSCNTCPLVIKNEERLKETAQYAFSKNTGIVLVNSNEGQRNTVDSYEAMQQYAKNQGYQWHYVLDKNSLLANAFHAGRTPDCFLFNAHDELVYHGAMDDNPSNANAVNRTYLKIAISEMTEGKEVSAKETRSVGCAIKRIK